MGNSILTILCGLVGGLILGVIIVFNTEKIPDPLHLRHEVIGFLPYWLEDKTDTDFSTYISNLTYFGLTVDSDGSIIKLANEQEENPGWHALNSGSLNGMFKHAKENDVKLSLLVFNGDEESIGKLMSDPVPHAKRLVKEVVPIMRKHGFTELNIDIESVSVASDEARAHFTQFMREVKKGMRDNNAGVLSIDVSPTALIKKYLINPSEIKDIVDKIIFMTYDYHYQGSSVTGPVAPLYGAGETSEFDTEVAIDEALRIMPAEKIVLGLPLYGYEWETLRDSERSATIPGTGIAASNLRVEKLLETCSSCSAQLDESAKESYVIYKDEETGTYHQIFYPDKNSTAAKIAFAKNNRLAGVALWALGYEGKTIMDPLKAYK